MACYHPIPAYRTPSGEIHLWHEAPDSQPLRLPCGGCLGCKTAQARAWALRCHLELQQHRHTAFATLTYSDDTVPPTLRKRDLQLFLKRLRKKLRRRNLRFFASGEYGETTQRPHYHALLYGARETDKETINKSWGQGHTKTVAVTPAAVNYVAGYCAKKIGWAEHTRHERIDYDTGEVYTWQPPFIQMSRRPGIGGESRKHTTSWRAYAIYNGARIPVPRYLHEAWKATATEEEIEHLSFEKYQQALTRDTSPARLQAAEHIAIAKQNLKAQRRKL